MTYNETLEYIQKSIETGKKHTLDSLRELLSKMGNPQESYRIIHVAGTNGKGSVSAMISGILSSAGYRTGLFTSPHLEKYNERISVNGVPISDESFAETSSIVRSHEESMQGLYSNLSFFEVLTITSYLYFARENVDFAVIEVGIGGRLDATNAAEHTFLSVITPIGYDHCEILGNTLEEIAAEKGGIIKKNTPVVLCLTTNGVYNRIKKICCLFNAKLYYFDESYYTDNIQYGINKTIFSVSSGYFIYKDLILSCVGQYQVFNACHALLCIHVLRGLGVSVSELAVREGLSKLKWPGRMEVACTNPLLILDGAHNIDSVDAFCDSIKPFCNNKRHIVVVGVLKTKDYIGIMERLSRTADFMIITQPCNEKALTVDEAAASLSTLNFRTASELLPNYREAIEKAFAMADSDTVISVVGSLYLVGSARKYLLEVKK